MASRKNLTDRTLKALNPARPGTRYEVMDMTMPGLAVRVTDKGTRTFALIARYPGSSNPTRRALGEYPAISLEKARKRAGEWRELIRQGIDPAEQEEREREVRAAKRKNTFGAAIEEYLESRAKKRKAADVSREIRRELIPAWGDKPLIDITREHVKTLVKAIARRPAPYQAHNVFGHIRTFFNWAIEDGDYGLEASPCDRLKPKNLIGAKEPRQRVLSDDELLAFWRAAKRLGYSFGPMFSLIALTGQRKSEVSDAQWREFHPEFVRLIRQAKEPINWSKVPDDIKVWTVPLERFKSDAAHLVPLTDEVCSILEGLPAFKRGDHLFTTTFGEKPVSGFSKAKGRLDGQMLCTLKALARIRGSDPEQVKLAPFVIHDLRRTMRTRLASLKVADVVAEMVIGHGRKGIQRVYDQHKYLDEMREALELWAGRLRDIVQLPPANVVKLAARA